MSDLNTILVLESTVELGLFGGGLESTVTELGGSIDEGKGDLLEGTSSDVVGEGLAESDDSLSGTHDRTLDHDPVVLDNTVVRETTHRGNSLLGEIGFGGGRVGITSSTHTVDLLVDHSTVVVTVLTSTGNGEVDTGRMPSTNTSNLTETTVSLTRKTGGTPTGGDTFVTLTLGHTNGIDHFVHLENIADLDLLFQKALGESDLLFHGTTVHLDFHQVSLLLANVQLLDLSVSEDTDNLAVINDLLQLVLHIFLTFSSSKASSVLGEGLSLAVVPVLVEAALARIVHVLSEHSGEGAETLRSLNVTDNTDNDHRRSFENGNGFDNFLLMSLATRTIQGTDDVSHTSLVTHEGSKMGLLRGIILGEASDVTTVVSASLTGEETEITVTRT